MSQPLPVICLMGPTACGKSKLAVELAQEWGCEIVSVDSVLVYRGMDIGTAKPNLEERQGIPHHLIDILDPSQVFSTGQFRNKALEIIDSIRERGKIPLLVGGTMLYFRSLLKGLAPLPSADYGIREQIEEQAGIVGWQQLHRELAKVDPAAAARIHPNDPQRIQRALEVFQITGQSITDVCSVTEPVESGFRPIALQLVPADRERLHQRIETRFHEMLATGLVDEVAVLHRRKDLNPTCPSIRAVGYRQVWSYLDGEIDFPSMTERGIIATRQLAKRQMTWMRKESARHRFEVEKTDLRERILKQMEPLLG